MPWNLVQLLLIISTVFSVIAMVNYAISKDKDQSMWSLVLFNNAFRIPEYIEITRKEKGRIGSWFWVFIVSVCALALVSIVQFASSRL